MAIKCCSLVNDEVATGKISRDNW